MRSSRWVHETRTINCNGSLSLYETARATTETHQRGVSGSSARGADWWRETVCRRPVSLLKPDAEPGQNRPANRIKHDVAEPGQNRPANRIKHKPGQHDVAEPGQNRQVLLQGLLLNPARTAKFCCKAYSSTWPEPPSFAARLAAQPGQNRQVLLQGLLLNLARTAKFCCKAYCSTWPEPPSFAARLTAQPGQNRPQPSKACCWISREPPRFVTRLTAEPWPEPPSFVEDLPHAKSGQNHPAFCSKAYRILNLTKATQLCCKAYCWTRPEQYH